MKREIQGVIQSEEASMLRASFNGITSGDVLPGRGNRRALFSRQSFQHQHRKDPSLIDRLWFKLTVYHKSYF